MDKQQCAYCGNPLRSHNKTGYCYKHRELSPERKTRVTYKQRKQGKKMTTTTKSLEDFASDCLQSNGFEKNPTGGYTLENREINLSQHHLAGYLVLFVYNLDDEGNPITVGGGGVILQSEQTIRNFISIIANLE
jgi:hypothetical protein